MRVNGIILLRVPCAGGVLALGLPRFGRSDLGKAMVILAAGLWFVAAGPLMTAVNRDRKED